MSSEKGLYYQVTTFAITAGSIALIGMVVVLYFVFLPERNLIIRYTEISLFLFCIPLLLREAWVRLNKIKYSIRFLKLALIIISMLIAPFLYLAFAEGGILTIEFLIVAALMISIIVLTSVGSDNINRALNRIYSTKTAAATTVVHQPSLSQTAD